MLSARINRWCPGPGPGHHRGPHPISRMLLLALAVSALVTSFLSGVLGMAGGVILMGLLLALLPVADAMVLHGVTQLAANGWRAAMWRRSIDWRTFRGCALGALLACAVFVSFQLVLSRPAALIALGLTPLTVYLLPKNLQLNVDRPGQPLACGLVNMSMQLLSGVSGPLLDSFFVRSSLDRRAVVATKAAIQTLGHLLKIVYFGALVAAAGQVDPWVAGLMVACAVVGTSLSRQVLDRMSDTDFRTWTRRLLLATSSVYLVAGIWQATR